MSFGVEWSRYLIFWLCTTYSIVTIPASKLPQTNPPLKRMNEQPSGIDSKSSLFVPLAPFPLPHPQKAKPQCQAVTLSSQPSNQ